ncbi:MAG: hypothetical protein ACK4HM_02035 [Thermosynechococcus sp.]
MNAASSGAKSNSPPDWLLKLLLPAIEEGRQWGYQFLGDPRWGGRSRSHGQPRNL